MDIETAFLEKLQRAIAAHGRGFQTEMATYQHTSAALRRATVARFGTVVPAWAQKTAADSDV